MLAMIIQKQVDKLFDKYWILTAATPVVITVMCVLAFGVNVPFNEQWEFSVPIADLLTNPQNMWPELWKLHNEHRLIVPKFIMIVTASITQWDIRAELYINIAIAGITLFWLIRKTKQTLIDWGRECGQSQRTSNIILVLIAFLTFSMAQAENWMWGWQLQIFLNILVTVAGYDWLTRGSKLTYGRLAMAAICGLFATFSFANGLLYWIVGSVGLLIHMYNRRATAGMMICWVVISTTVWVSYLTNYHPVDEHPPMGYVFAHPIEAVEYLLAYLGNAISQFRQFIWLGISVGFVGIILVVMLIVQLVKQRKLIAPALVFWHLLLLYALCSGAVTAIGRTGFGIEQAFSSRYVTISNLFWFWIIVTGFLLYNNKLVNLNKYVHVVMCVFALLFIASTAKNIYKFKQRHDELLIVANAIRINKYDYSALIKAHPKPKVIMQLNNRLRLSKLSFYKQQSSN